MPEHEARDRIVVALCPEKDMVFFVQGSKSGAQKYILTIEICRAQFFTDDDAEGIINALNEELEQGRIWPEYIVGFISFDIEKSVQFHVGELYSDTIKAAKAEATLN